MSDENAPVRRGHRAAREHLAYLAERRAALQALHERPGTVPPSPPAAAPTTPHTEAEP